ncbi:MAG: hypothetical protein ACJ8C4_12675 [Gemmataceae bacterium]
MRRLSAIVLLLPILSGCLSHAACVVPPDAIESCRDTPCPCRHKVYVAMLHGFDPFDWDQLSPMRQTLNDAGFTKTFYGHWYHVGDFAKEIARGVGAEPGSQVVIVCTGFGIEPAHELAEKLHSCDVEVAALIGIGAPSWAAKMYSAPEGVGQVCYVQKKGAWSFGANDGVDVIDVENTKGGSLANDPEVASLVLAVLAAQTKAIPFTAKPRGDLSFANPVATPHVVVAEEPSGDDWQVLRPVAKLAPPGQSPSKATTVLKPEK